MELPDLAVEKRCWTCHEVKPLRAFPRDKGRPDGRGGRCRACDRARAAAYRAAHLEEERARQRAYQQQRYQRRALTK